MKVATANASSAAPAPITMTTLKPISEGSAVPPKSVVIRARITPARALAKEVPRDRIKVLRLFAAPVWVGSTAPMIRAGSAP